ncbi:MAG: hypothetical protein ACNA7O_15650 [Rhodobacterales bacterium]
MAQLFGHPALYLTFMSKNGAENEKWRLFRRRAILWVGASLALPPFLASLLVQLIFGL